MVMVPLFGNDIAMQERDDLGREYLVVIRRFSHIVCKMELTVRAVLGPDPVLRLALSALE